MPISSLRRFTRLSCERLVQSPFHLAQICRSSGRCNQEFLFNAGRYGANFFGLPTCECSCKVYRVHSVQVLTLPSSLPSHPPSPHPSISLFCVNKLNSLFSDDLKLLNTEKLFFVYNLITGPIYRNEGAQ